MENLEIVHLKTAIEPQHTLAVRLLISGLANLIQFNSDEIEDLKLAVSEACYCVHDPESAVDLMICLESGKMTIEVQGTTTSKKPMLGMNDAAEEGLGILLMRNLVDSMEFKMSDAGTSIRLTKVPVKMGR